MNRLTNSGPIADHRQPLSDLVALVDLPALVQNYAGPGRGAGNTVTFRCPNPQHSDRNPSFTVTKDNSGKWRAACWSQCQFRGDALDLVCWLDGCTKAEAADRLRSFMGLPAREIWVPPVQKRPAAPPEPKAVQALTAQQQKVNTPDAETCRKVMTSYLKHRGWNESVVDQFGLSVVADSRGTLSIRHPFHADTPEGRAVVAYQDRLVGKPDNDAPKWKGPKGVALPLYNVTALAGEVRAVVICEGPADTISATVAMHQAAEPRVVAVGVAGVKAWRTEWAHLFTGRMVLTAADNDEAGDGLRKKLEHDLLPVASSVQHLLLPSDINDFTEYCLKYGHARIGDEIAGGLWHRLLSLHHMTAEVVS